MTTVVLPLPIKLLSGSDAIDAGVDTTMAVNLPVGIDPLTTDQRGGTFARKIDGGKADAVDIGSFEAPSSIF